MQLTALRSTARLLLRHKSFSLINILGLAIGLSACLLLYLYVQFELSYDAYNDKAARIVRVTSILHSPESDITIAGTPAALAPALLRDCPESKRPSGWSRQTLLSARVAKRLPPPISTFLTRPSFRYFPFLFSKARPKQPSPHPIPSSSPAAPQPFI